MMTLRQDPAQFRQDLFNIARTTLSSKVLSQDKDYFANLAVDAVLRLKVQQYPLLPNLVEYSTICARVQPISSTFRSSKRSAASSPTHISMRVSYHHFSVSAEDTHQHFLGFILDKTIGTNCPKRLENAKILIANTCWLPFALCTWSLA